MNSPYFLEMTKISKTFPGAKVLDEVELRIKAGEVRALMGENGAGKSTLIKILGGIYSKDPGGSIRIAGKEVQISDVKDAKQHGISIIHQEISLAENMTVFDNLFMGEELIGKTRLFLNDRQMTQKAQQIMDELGVGIDVRTRVGKLSIAKQQMVEIARALLSNAKLIVMDEPTSSLTKNEIDQLFFQIEKLKKQNIAIIYISHRMDEIFRVSDSVTVLRDGQMIGTHSSGELDQNKIITMMVGREISEIYEQKADTRGKECLRVEHFTNGKLKDVGFSLRSGEILGFAGLVGAGRTELARAIFGVDRISRGEIWLDGNAVSIRNPQDAIEKGIAYVPENRKSEGLFLANTIRYNTTISILEHFIAWIGVNRKKETQFVDEYAKALSVRMVSPDQKVQFLSGGNQQKVVLSKWLATKPRILILDEPTRGIDIGAKSEIYHLITKLASEGVAIMMISSEMEEIINLSHRVMVMCEGRVSGMLERGAGQGFSQEEIMFYASGGNRDENH